MTISYLIDMSSSTFCGIHRLLFRWRGSIWKSIYPELLVWLGSYSAMSLSYRYLMNETQRILFEDICVFFFTYSDYIPITFMLGFYVTAVFNRWHDVFDCLGWIDSPALLIATYVRGSSEEMRNVRRNIIRYMVLVQALVFRDISTAVQKRFPTMDHLVTSGLMTTNELQEFDSITSPHIKFWTPIQWAFLLLRRCRDKGIIESDMIYVDILDIRAFRLSVLTLTLYDWVPMPLVYTQVVNIAVRTYFIIALFARQYMIGDRELPNKHNIDLFLPIMTILQFLFYIGWMKVAEIMINPLGEDDDDFETNWVIDRNLQVGFCIVDNGYGRVPIVEHDVFWDQNCPEPLYTAEAADRNAHGYVGSCSDAAAQEDALLLPPRKRRLMSTVALPPSLSEIQELESGISGGENGSVVQVQNHNPTRRKSVCIGPNWQSAPGEGGQEGSLFGNIREIGRKLSKSVRFDGVSPLPSQGASSSPQPTEESPRGRDINGSVHKGGDGKEDGWLGRFSTIVEESESNANSRRGSAAAVKYVYTIPSISMNTSEAQRPNDETTMRVKGRRTAYETASSSSSSSSGSLSSMDDETKR